MEKYESLEDKKIYDIVVKTLRNYNSFHFTEISKAEFLLELKKFKKLVKGHEKLLTAIGKL